MFDMVKKLNIPLEHGDFSIWLQELGLHSSGYIV